MRRAILLFSMATAMLLLGSGVALADVFTGRVATLSTAATATTA